MTTPPSAHTDFVIERRFAVPPGAVFQAWADPQARRLWSDCHGECGSEQRFDFRPMGHETHRVVHADGRTQTIERVYFDIVVDRRIVFGYDIRLDARPLSVSLVTVEFFAAGRGACMVYTEQLAYLDGHEDRARRLQGTQEGLDRLVLLLSPQERAS